MAFSNVDEFWAFFRERRSIHQSTGKDFLEANSLAQLDAQIAQWPDAPEGEMPFVVYGDFLPPSEDMSFPSLGITLSSRLIENGIGGPGVRSFQGAINVREKSVEQVLDATKRLNTFLGSILLVSAGNAAIGWWSAITHGNISSSAVGQFEPHLAQTAIQSLDKLKASVRRKVEAALYWIRGGRGLFVHQFQGDTLRRYAAYWNAFECLVEAASLSQSPPKTSQLVKLAEIAQFVAGKGGEALTLEDVGQLYRIVDPGLRAKASHAFSVCVAADADGYLWECFTRPERAERLYNIRNAINHGEVDAENVNELARVDAKFNRLWMIVHRMLGHFLDFPIPADTHKPERT